MSHGSRHSTKKTRIKRLSAYFYMPIIFACLGVLILYLGMLPVVKNVSGIIGLIIAKDAPSFTDKLTDGFIGTDYNGETVDIKDIDFPDYNSKFAEVKCDRIGLLAPIYYGDNDMCLHFGAGLSLDSKIPGFGSPVLLSGHNSTFFSPIEKIQQGDIIVITTNYGIYSYEVNDIEILNLKDFDRNILSSDGDGLIVYTCYPFTYVGGVGNKRMFVNCTKVSGPTVVGIMGDEDE